ncbi:hypothetical protein HYPSUDRAFT_143333 [Hypholoma sublateritium FD-334 SS-4]|uniref:Hydrophobin n=1 Tax=Hypholoma sublateritium (strain FD-334 SS-4) TaxID=945553 RepID=A0A0D2NLM1_HYPSF|nr:hypothetical protein HYPSUDRAFT_143333 [Hypholoma sublateritium FD-334 SS-4]
MQYLKLSAVVALALVTFAAATPTPQGAGSNQCNTGSAQCCQSVQQSDSASLSGLLSLLGIVLQGLAIPVGVTCSPITVVGVSGTSCIAQPVCCTNNSFNGIVALGCTPINVNL